MNDATHIESFVPGLGLKAISGVNKHDLVIECCEIHRAEILLFVHPKTHEETY